MLPEFHKSQWRGWSMQDKKNANLHQRITGELEDEKREVFSGSLDLWVMTCQSHTTMPFPSGISMEEGTLHAAQLWPARSDLMELKWKTGLLPSAQQVPQYPWLASLSTRHLTFHGWSIQAILISTPGVWTKMLHELGTNTPGINPGHGWWSGRNCFYLVIWKRKPKQTNPSFCLFQTQSEHSYILPEIASYSLTPDVSNLVLYCPCQPAGQHWQHP